MLYFNSLRWIIYHNMRLFMKYFVLVFDGMADRKIKELGNMTPMEAADKPVTDMLAKDSIVGTVLNVPVGMVPESDTANLAILSYDPRKYSHGRSPLEAVGLGLRQREDETAYRCNIVTLSEEYDYDNKIMIDHSADEISSDEASKLIAALEEKLGSADRHFYPGVSYRHCLLWKNGDDKYPFMRPHDILGKRITEYLPHGKEGEPFYRLMRESWDILDGHPVNAERRRNGKRPANSAWLWSPGKKPMLPSFSEKWGMHGAVISAVDLIKGISLLAGMDFIPVEGATGNISTNYEGKAAAAVKAFSAGADFVFVHVEAPDECGHRGEIENKVKSIEYIDKRILKPVYEYLKATGEDYKIMILPDHPTPIELRTHSSDPVPFEIFDSTKKHKGAARLTEDLAEQKKFYIPDGTRLLDIMIKNEGYTN